ncbi:hypothetical protein, partial [Bacillus toyonensis]
NGVWRAEYPIQYPSTSTSVRYNATQFGKNVGEHVEAYRVIYRNASGEMTAQVSSYYDVQKGATGQTTNSVKYNFELNDGTKVALVPIDDTTVHG